MDIYHRCLPVPMSVSRTYNLTADCELTAAYLSTCD